MHYRKKFQKATAATTIIGGISLITYLNQPETLSTVDKIQTTLIKNAMCGTFGICFGLIGILAGKEIGAICMHNKNIEKGEEYGAKIGALTLAIIGFYAGHLTAEEFTKTKNNTPNQQHIMNVTHRQP